MPSLVYKNKGYAPLQAHFEKLWEVVREFDEDNELVKQLKTTINDLQEASKANLEIKSHNRVVGYGVDVSKKNIACEQVIAIVREIKKLKGW